MSSQPHDPYHSRPPQHYGPAPQHVLVVPQTAPRSVLVAYLLWFFLGLWGIHRFYAGDTTGGVIWLLTGALCGFGWLVDIFSSPASSTARTGRSTRRSTPATAEARQPRVDTWVDLVDGVPPRGLRA